ncbi:alpha-amylase family glycosyl hydrolase [Nonomuraea rubra]|uniref:alpha-amylase family glycosyl hydrolase n=1 Tax=Nonomuraea rubra TaxID=46180 RepID=UPI0031EE712B
MFYFDPVTGDYESWWGFKTLPKLNWGSELVRSHMTAVLKKWLGPFDGWRVDVANMTGRRGADDYAAEVAARLRARLGPGAAFIAEHNHDATRDLDRDGWQGTMNYGGFTRPVWTWLRGPDCDLEHFLGVPGGVPHRDGTATLAAFRSFASQMSWRSLVHSWQLLDSHDTPRVRHSDRLARAPPARHRPAGHAARHADGLRRQRVRPDRRQRRALAHAHALEPARRPGPPHAGRLPRPVRAAPGRARPAPRRPAAGCTPTPTAWCSRARPTTRPSSSPPAARPASRSPSARTPPASTTPRTATSSRAGDLRYACGASHADHATVASADSPVPTR